MPRKSRDRNDAPVRLRRAELPPSPIQQHSPYRAQPVPAPKSVDQLQVDLYALCAAKFRSHQDEHVRRYLDAQMMTVIFQIRQRQGVDVVAPGATP